MLDVLTQNAGHKKTPPTIDMQKLFFAYTMDSISKIFFGRETNTMCNVKDELAESFDKAHRFMIIFMWSHFTVLCVLAIVPVMKTQTSKSVSTNTPRC